MKYKTLIEIDADFGSKFQKEFGIATLENMLMAWRAYMRQSHKKNCIVIYKAQPNSGVSSNQSSSTPNVTEKEKND